LLSTHAPCPGSHILSYVFFYCHGDPRDLHSFPTRRSSDLAADGSGDGGGAGDQRGRGQDEGGQDRADARRLGRIAGGGFGLFGKDRKSTRLNSSHVKISYAVFCLKKKNRKTRTHWHATSEQ